MNELNNGRQDTMTTPPVAGASDTTTTDTTTTVKKKTVHSTSQPLLPKRDEGTLVEIMRIVSNDLRSLCDAVNQLNAELDAKDKPSEQDHAQAKALLKQMNAIVDQVMKINAFLIEQQAMNYKDILKWFLWAATACVAVAIGLKEYGLV